MTEFYGPSFCRHRNGVGKIRSLLLTFNLSIGIQLHSVSTCVAFELFGVGITPEEEICANFFMEALRTAGYVCVCGAWVNGLANRLSADY